MIFSLLGFRFSYSSQINLIMDSSSIHSDELPEETISDSFICCVCLDLLYKPIILECGHVSCFWCVHKSMNPGRVSHCPICRNSYHYFPTICEMLHYLLIKMYPVAYRRQEQQMLEEEKKTGFFSPQLDGQVVNSIGESKSSHGENSSSDNSCDRSCKSVSSADLLCPACKHLLFRPAALNCGHVFCKACIVVPEDGVIICKVCEIPHPSDCPNICLELDNFVEEQFPDEYVVRKENVAEMKLQFQHKKPPSCCNPEKSHKKRFKTCQNEEDLSWWKEYGSKLHYGAGCDYCGMYPIVGDRYRCKDCVEEIGFDLCGDCYKTSSKRPGRFNQQHTPDHKFELLKPLELSASLMFRLVGGHIVDSSEAPVLAISDLEDSSDGWIAVDSADFQQTIDENAPDGDRATLRLDNILDGSDPMDFSDARETVGDDVDSLVRHDDDMEDHRKDSPSA